MDSAPGSERSKPRPPGFEEPPEKKEPETQTFPVVGIGASAGGLQAFRKLLDHLPPDRGLCFPHLQTARQDTHF